MNTINIDKELGIAMSTIAIKCNFYQHMDNNPNRAIIVEGQTDEQFLNRIKSQNVLCIKVNFLKARAAMLNSLNAKDIIIKLFLRLSNNPEFYDFPKGCGSWHIYGLIDRDYDDDIPKYYLPRLFITDTHDIETLILYTDNNVLNRIKGVNISEEALRYALYLAGQLSYYRRALYRLGSKRPEIDLKSINSADGRIDFTSFVEQNRIIPSKLLKLIYSNRNISLSKEKLKTLTHELLSDKQLKRHLNSDGEWKHPVESFSSQQMEDFWLNVRGHDILSAICFYDSSANAFFRSADKENINRKFEQAIICGYDISKFSSTDLYKQLNAAKLVNDIDF